MRRPPIPILSVPCAAGITAIFLSPLRGFLNFFSFLSWGSRPRLCICRRSAARDRVTTFRQDLTDMTGSKKTILMHPASSIQHPASSIQHLTVICEGAERVWPMPPLLV